jgi:glycosyltransferase involved in cell wall biosynthesis
MSAPLFSVITPVFRPPIGFFLDCVQSVVDQTCRDWELVLVDDGNDSAELLAAMANLETGHEAIRVVRSTRNVGIAAASQLGLAAATGQFVALLDHDDLLTPDALERVAEMLESAPDTDYLYTDEDKIGEDGEFYDPSFKPDWSPERFRSHMYTCHLSVVRRKLALESGGFRRGFEGSQDYDFILRVTERARRVVHLPEIHYHWRAHVGSTALHALQKPEAYAAAKRALTEHCQRVGIEADVLDGVTIGGYRVARRLTSRPLVSLVIPTKGSVAPVRGRDEVLVKHLIESIERRTTYDNFEYVVVHDARMAGNVASEVRESCGHAFVAVPYAYDDDSFNFSEAVNRGVARARGDIIVLLNDDMELITPDWLDEFVGLLTDADVGAVGGKYFFADESIQHAGVCVVGAPSHMFYRMPRGTNQILGLHLTVTREVSALTGACLAVSRANFLAVGGFTEQ